MRGLRRANRKADGMSPKPFPEDPNLGVITTTSVLAGQPILMVSHDADDGGWQFLCGSTDDPSHGCIVHLQHILAIDPSVSEVADLPLGWVAYRHESAAPWIRGPQ
jgi:hypothetical protein